MTRRRIRRYLPPLGVVVAAAVFWLLGPLGLIATGERKWWDATKDRDAD